MKKQTLSVIGGSVVLAIALTACAAQSGSGFIASTPAPVTVTATATSTAKVTATSTAKVTVTATKQTTVPVPRPVTRTETTTRTQTRIATTTAPPPQTLEEPTAAQQVGMSDAQIRTDTASAVDVVETYWTDLFSTWVDDAGQPVSWWRPTLLGGDGFFDSAAGQDAYCGTEGDTAGNAFFCGNVASGTGYMAWDMQLFRDYGYLGNALIYMVVAHETAHAAQIRFEHDGEGPAVLAERELQARLHRRRDTGEGRAGRLSDRSGRRVERDDESFCGDW